MNSKYYLIFLVCSGLLLGACSRDDDDDDQESESEEENELAIFGALDADDEPLPLSTKLAEDIREALGEADDATTDVVIGDTVQTVIDRADTD